MAIQGLSIDVQGRFSALCTNIEAYLALEKYESKVKELPWDHPLKKPWFDEITNLKVRLMNSFCQKDNICPTDGQVQTYIKEHRLMLPLEAYTNPKDWVEEFAPGYDVASRKLSEELTKNAAFPKDRQLAFATLKSQYCTKKYVGTVKED
jgi:hypothetical protein